MAESNSKRLIIRVLLVAALLIMMVIWFRQPPQKTVGTSPPVSTKKNAPERVVLIPPELPPPVGVRRSPPATTKPKTPSGPPPVPRVQADPELPLPLNQRVPHRVPKPVQPADTVADMVADTVAASAKRAPTESAEDEEDPPPMVWSTDGAGIRAAMDSARAPIGECYDAWVRENPTLGGKLVVRFVIEAPEEPEDDTSGRVTSVEIPQSALKHPLLEGCVLNAVANFRFSNPDEPITVNYPFSFVAEEPGGDDDEP